MRCGCFAHAQELLRQGTPLILAPRAVAIHDLPPVVRERTRQGYDSIAACWANSRLREARWLWLGVLSVPLFLALRIMLDWTRLLVGYRDLGLGIAGLLAALTLAPILRLLDAVGMVHASRIGRPAPGRLAAVTCETVRDASAVPMTRVIPVAPARPFPFGSLAAGNGNLPRR